MSYCNECSWLAISPEPATAEFVDGIPYYFHQQLAVTRHLPHNIVIQYDDERCAILTPPEDESRAAIRRPIADQMLIRMASVGAERYTGHVPLFTPRHREAPGTIRLVDGTEYACTEVWK